MPLVVLWLATRSSSIIVVITCRLNYSKQILNATTGSTDVPLECIDILEATPWQSTIRRGDKEMGGVYMKYENSGLTVIRCVADNVRSQLEGYCTGFLDRTKYDSRILSMLSDKDTYSTRSSQKTPPPH